MRRASAAFVCAAAYASTLFSSIKCLRRPRSKRRLSTQCTASTSPTSVAASVASQNHPVTTTIACVGDIHGQWDDIDESALRNLNPDLALFVGDYGDEDVQTTKRIARFAETVDFGVATVFGNHDAFFTASINGRRRAPYNKAETCRVTEQMEIMAPYDVSYRSVPFHDIAMSVCGGRAFSVGGPNWKHSDFYQKFVGVFGLDHSTSKMLEAVNTSRFQTLIFLSHSGPVGLGDKPSDPCGKDWGKHRGGDYGDQDLRIAIEKAREEGFRVPLVVFGHMHKGLMYGQGNRTMLKTEADGDKDQETVMLNAAVVPRHMVGSKSNAGLRHFQIAQLDGNGYVKSVEEGWFTATGEKAQSTRLYDVESLSESGGVTAENNAAMTVN